jgi:hypothetical protein
MTVRNAPAQPLTAVLEKEWDRDLFSRKGLATMFGWESQWTFLSKGSRAGYPDRTACRERILFVELKREPSVASPITDAQRGWLDRLAAADGEVYLWRPSDLEEVARILAHRGRPDTYLATAWLPGIGRADTTEQQSLLTKRAAVA